jgi:mandelamide amidase
LPSAPPPEAVAGPCAGLTLAIKDSIDVAGMPTRAASPALPDTPAERDAPVVAALRAAGAQVLGKANMHELAFGITSENPWAGDVRNPVLPGHIAGGSSGGTASAIAAGLAEAGLATDTGGSARIPAAMCGIAGFRPSTGRYSSEGLLRLTKTFDSVGLMGRTAADVERLDAAITGRAPLPTATVWGLRLAVPRAVYCDGLEAAVASTFETALDRLRGAGCLLVERDVSGLPPEVERWHLAIALHEVERIWRAHAESRGQSLAEFAGAIATPRVRAIFEALAAGEAPSETAYRQAVDVQRTTFRRAYADYLAETGARAIVAPAVPIAPPPSGPRPDSEEGVLFDLLTRNMLPATITRQPSISLPIGGVTPAGLLLDGRPDEDEQLLALALAVESVLTID